MGCFFETPDNRDQCDIVYGRKYNKYNSYIIETKECINELNNSHIINSEKLTKTHFLFFSFQFKRNDQRHYNKNKNINYINIEQKNFPNINVKLSSFTKEISNNKSKSKDKSGSRINIENNRLRRLEFFKENIKDEEGSHEKLLGAPIQKSQGEISEQKEQEKRLVVAQINRESPTDSKCTGASKNNVKKKYDYGRKKAINHLMWFYLKNIEYAQQYHINWQHQNQQQHLKNYCKIFICHLKANNSNNNNQNIYHLEHNINILNHKSDRALIGINISTTAVKQIIPITNFQPFGNLNNVNKEEDNEEQLKLNKATNTAKNCTTTRWNKCCRKAKQQQQQQEHQLKTNTYKCYQQPQKDIMQQQKQPKIILPKENESTNNYKSELTTVIKKNTDYIKFNGKIESRNDHKPEYQLQLEQEKFSHSICDAIRKLIYNIVCLFDSMCQSNGDKVPAILAQILRRQENHQLEIQQQQQQQQQEQEQEQEDILCIESKEVNNNNNTFVQQQQQEQQDEKHLKHRTFSKHKSQQLYEQHMSTEIRKMRKKKKMTTKMEQQYENDACKSNCSSLQLLTCSDNNNSNRQQLSHNNSSFSFFAASSIVLMICFLATSAGAVPDSATTGGLGPKNVGNGVINTFIDKHPIFGIDWTKFDESSSDKEILDLLLEKKRYDKRLLPPVNDEDFCCGLSSPDMAINHNPRGPHKRGTLTVNVNVLLLSLASPDESSLKYEVEFLLNQQWNDPRLQYGNKSHYDFLNALHHHDSIWTPDTYFIMHGDFKDPIIPMHFALRIYRNGTITYAMRRHLILSCQGSLHIFPFDDPKCSFSMESISYEEAQIKYVWKNDEDTLRKSPSLTTLNAYLIKNQTTACDQNSWRGNYSCLRVDLIFTRDRAFYFTTVFIPGIILVTSSFITFWLEWNAVPARSMIGNYSCLQVELSFTRDRAYYFTTVFIPGVILVTSSFITFWLEWNAVPARVMIGVTTMLNFFTTSNGFRSTLPVVSNLTAMNVWDGVCMCFIYASLLEFVCVNYVGRKRPLHNVVYRPGENPVTQRLPAVLSRIGVILASPLAAAGTSTAGTSMRVTPGERTPAHVNLELLQAQNTSIISEAVQNIRLRSIKRQSSAAAAETAKTSTMPAQRKGLDYVSIEPVYEEPSSLPQIISEVDRSRIDSTVKPGADTTDNNEYPSTSGLQLSRLCSKSTNTPPLVERGTEKTQVTISSEKNVIEPRSNTDLESAERQETIKPPPRKKLSRSCSPMRRQEVPNSSTLNGAYGEKRRDTGAPNEIVACTTCGGSSSPCTHSVNNGCATETCFVRKKEPPHPIRVAKTIDVIARITFPIAYSIFLIFFFVHYKGFS